MDKWMILGICGVDWRGFVGKDFYFCDYAFGVAFATSFLFVCIFGKMEGEDWLFTRVFRVGLKFGYCKIASYIFYNVII